MKTYEISLFENPAPRCPVVLLLDASASMQGAAIEALNRGVQQFFEEIHGDEVARFSVEVEVISFGYEGAKQEMPFTSVIHPVTVPKLVANGGTPMGEALELGLASLENRRNFYRKSGISSYKPWMVLMTDGMPNDDWVDAAECAISMSDRKELVYLGVGIGEGVDWELLERILPENRPPKALEGIRFHEFFEWLSDSLKMVSRSSTQQSIPLPSTSGWEAI